MGWRGTLRSVGAAMRAAERDSKRRQRDLEKRQKQYEKMQEIEQASYEVEVYENKIEILRSVHKDCSDYIDWASVAKIPQPMVPVKSTNKEELAKLKHANYRPGLFARVFRLEKKIAEKLKNGIATAIQEDNREYQDNIEKYKKANKDWEDNTGFARRLLAGDAKAKMESIKELNPFSELSSIGSGVEIIMDEKGRVEAVVNVRGDNVVPREVKTLLKSGKLSAKEMPKSMFNEIYQDYVCACVLRVANELFAIIPDAFVIVTAVDRLLDSKTGHLEKQPIVSALISRITLKSLNMNQIDPSNSMGNFVHNMIFKKAKGFEAVAKVAFEDMDIKI